MSREIGVNKFLTCSKPPHAGNSLGDKKKKMIQDLEQIEYRCGMFMLSMKAN